MTDENTVISGPQDICKPNINITEIADDELFSVLLCGCEPKYGYTVNDYAEEWNRRCDHGMQYEVNV
jgi:hypothetical protein